MFRRSTINTLFLNGNGFGRNNLGFSEISIKAAVKNLLKIVMFDGKRSQIYEFVADMFGDLVMMPGQKKVFTVQHTFALTQ